jgi:uncharacterized C2H2 Zn-finger protein
VAKIKTPSLEQLERLAAKKVNPKRYKTSTETDIMVGCPHCKQLVNVSKSYNQMVNAERSYCNVRSCPNCQVSFGIVIGMMGLQCYETLLLNNQQHGL